MLPAQRNKVDISKLTAAEQQAFRLYGKLPSRPVAKSQERKYFDSGDWALSKAGKQKDFGKEIPTPDAIPHASPSPLVGSATTSNTGAIGSGASTSPGSGGIIGSPASFGGMMSPPQSSSTSSGINSSSPPGSFVIGNTGGTSPTGLSQSSSTAPGAVPMATSPSASSSSQHPVSLSMSPGRVGIGGSMGASAGFAGAGAGTGLATSPTRSFGSFPIAHSHNSSHHHHSYSSTSTSPTGSSSSAAAAGGIPSSVGVGIHIGSASSSSGFGSNNGGTGAGTGIGLAGTPPMVAATTGNQIGKTQIRRTSQSEGNANNLPGIGSVLPPATAVNASSNMGGVSLLDNAASPPPRSGLANSITPDSLMDNDDEDEGDENDDGIQEGITVNRAARGEDEQIEGMELQ